MGFGQDRWAPYVTVEQRRRQAEQRAARAKKKGQALQPVQISGHRIASSFWGQAWCRQLEDHGDHANRLPRGRTYVLNGAVIDLQIDAGRVRALVSGSDIYRVEVTIEPLPPARWKAIVKACAGQVASLIELLQGRLSKAVMTVVTDPSRGLFPATRQLHMSCSCPDSAVMCKHVAATLYGVGARLDQEPELLFTVRHVSALDLLAQGAQQPAAPTKGQTAGTLARTDLSALFGIDLDGAPGPSPAARPAAPQPAARARASGSKATAPAAQPRTKAGTTTAQALLARGVPRHMIQAWLASGVLVRGPERGVYRTTRYTASRIRAYLARREGG